jgi:hypothetical protein
MESDLAYVKGNSSMPDPLERAVGDGCPGDASPELEGHPGCSSSQVSLRSPLPCPPLRAIGWGQNNSSFLAAGAWLSGALAVVVWFWRQSHGLP